jgi:hypothetical protein
VLAERNKNGTPVAHGVGEETKAAAPAKPKARAKAKAPAKKKAVAKKATAKK